MLRISKKQARRFLLARNGLIGDERFAGKDGVADYLRTAGCIQCDTADVCGTSQEIALLARVKDFSRKMLDEMLYQERSLLEYYDKNQSLMCMDDWPCLEPIRKSFGRAKQSPLAEELLVQLESRESITAGEAAASGALSCDEQTLRNALESLFQTGRAVIHHRTDGERSYALAEKCIPSEFYREECPFANDGERQMWQVLRRIGAVGLLWDAQSEAWLGIEGLTPQSRSWCFAQLLRYEMICPVQVEGITLPLYILTGELSLLDQCIDPFPQEQKARLLPPLDCLLWDRRLISILFDFQYKCEMYTPPEQRKYGYYVLPVLLGEEFVGRVEPVADWAGNVLRIRHFWEEDGKSLSNRQVWMVEDALLLLAAYLGLPRCAWERNTAQ